MLFAGEGENGECVFRFLPSKSEMFGSPEIEFLFQYQEQGEFEWRNTGRKIEIENSTTGSQAVMENGTLKNDKCSFIAIRIAAS
jgi:hypothetical protein